MHLYRTGNVLGTPVVVQCLCYLMHLYRMANVLASIGVVVVSVLLDVTV